MSKERAIALLGTAKNLLSPEDMRRFIDSALVQLRTEADPIPAIKMSKDMIAGGLAQLSKNLPDQFDTPEELAEKFTICESALAQIKEYASAGLKARGRGSLDVAEDLLKGQANHSLEDFADDKDTKITIEHEGESVTVTPQQLSQAVNELERQKAGGE